MTVSEFTEFQNFHELLKSTVDRFPEQPAYRWFSGGNALTSVTWGDVYRDVQKAGKSLMALGVEKGTKLNILSYTCYKWVLIDLATMSVGGVTVGLYQSLLAKDCQYIIDHSDSALIFVENQEQLAKVLEIRDQIPKVRKVIMFEGEHKGDDWVITYDEFLALGESISDEQFQERVSGVTPEDDAGIVYTSGTTGIPKGAVLTHDNICFTSQSVCISLQFRHDEEEFLFLPLAHVFARLAAYATLLVGAPITFARSMETIVEDIKLARPNMFPSVPRIYEKVYAKVIGGAEAKGGLALKIFRWAREVGNQVSDCKLNKQPIPAGLNFKYKLASKLVFSKIQDALGGRVRWCISGAAPLSPEIAKFFHAAGILILEGIGMTENTSFTNINRHDNYRFGWVGPPGPGIEQKVSEDGELMYRGRNIMKGYYKMPEETAETITKDGWLLTGDLGEIDEEGFVRITGRKKDLIITAGGKNIAPSRIEGLISNSKYINQAFVIGDKRKYLVALVTIDPDNVKTFAEEQNISYNSFEELMNHEKVQALVEAEVEKVNKELASFETVKKVKIVPEFTIENGMITPTLKLKKNVIQERYKAEIDAMYS